MNTKTDIIERTKKYRWRKGQSGNTLGGKKKELSIIRHVRDILDELSKDKDNKNKTWARLVAEALVKAATMPQHKAYSTAIIELLNRIDGKPIDLSASITINMTPAMVHEAQSRLERAKQKTKEILEAEPQEFLPKYKTLELSAPSEHTHLDDERLDGLGQTNSDFMSNLLKPLEAVESQGQLFPEL